MLAVLIINILRETFFIACKHLMAHYKVFFTLLNCMFKLYPFSKFDTSFSDKSKKNIKATEEYLIIC